MLEPVQFDADLYRYDAVQRAAEHYGTRAAIEVVEAGSHIVARLRTASAGAEANLAALVDEFCNQALAVTVETLRGEGHFTPPWPLLAPFTQGSALGDGWTLGELSLVSDGAATLALQHARHGTVRVAIRRNGGAPVGVAYTDRLDFLVINGGDGATETDAAIGKALIRLAAALRRQTALPGGDDTGLALLQPHNKAADRRRNSNGQASRRIVPAIDLAAGRITFEFDEQSIDRPALYSAMLALVDSSFVFLSRGSSNRLAVQLKPRSASGSDALKALARDGTKALNRHNGLPALKPRNVDIDALLGELEAADASRAGLDYKPERGPGHENLRVLNIRGTGACDSECLFCIEKFNPVHRLMMAADATRELIAESAGKYDMLFFAAGEPTIHPKLFEYVELARRAGFTRFGMSSHFRTFADPRFALKTLQAGFEYFDISLHAADLENQIAVNPIGDGGFSLFEALKGLANLQRLADTIGVRISVTHKIVVSRLNVLQLESIFRATYDRGVRHFILQPVRTGGLDPEHLKQLEISEDEIMPHLNELLRRTEGLGATIKPYGFARQSLAEASHVEHEQNRVKNIYGRSRQAPTEVSLLRKLAWHRPRRAADGLHACTITDATGKTKTITSDGQSPLLDDGLRADMMLSFGCRMGSCGMCSAVLVKGEVDQSTQIFLTEEQMRSGYVLMCQARPLSDVVLRVCKEDEIDRL